MPRADDATPAVAPDRAAYLPTLVGKPLSLVAIVGISALCLIAGHLLLSEFMPNAAVGSIGFLLVAVFLGYILLVRNDAFGFMLAVYLCSHFSFADNQGGLWNLMTAGLIALHAAFGMRREKLPGSDQLALSLLAVLVIWNALGWVFRNPMPPVDRAQGAAAYLGFILMFYMVSNLQLTPERFRKFLALTVVMLVYQTIVGLNQRYALININTPLLGAYGKGIGFITYGSTNAQGTLRHSELFGEYGALMWCLLIPMLSSSTIQKQIRIGFVPIVVAMLLSLACITLTSTRSAALLAVAAAVAYCIVLPMSSIAAIDRLGRQVQVAIILGVLVPLVGAFIGLVTLEANFAELSGIKVTTGGVLSGADINRAPLFDLALRRMASDSWLIGYGFGTPRANLWAWIGADMAGTNMLADFHSLYLSLPMLFGWVGSLAFLGLILLTLRRTYTAARRHRRQRSFLVVLTTGFAMFWGVFLVDQFKISILRSPNYQMLFWIWLGLTTAAVRTLNLTSRAVPRPTAVTAPDDTGLTPDQTYQSPPDETVPSEVPPEYEPPLP